MAKRGSRKGYRRADLFDMEDPKELEQYNDLLKSENVHDYDIQIITGQMGGCKVLLHYHIYDPVGEIEPFPGTDPDEDRDS